MNNEIVETISIIFQLLLKSLIFGVMPFLVFMMLTSRTSLFGIRSFVVLTGSMQPTFLPGSVVFTQSFDQYKTGDIVAFKSGNVNVTHRIIDSEIKNNNLLYKTQGDANISPDGQQISGDKVIGKVFYHLPYVGKLAIFLKTIPGFISLIVLPALIFIFFEIINIKNEFTKEIEKKLIQKMQTV